MFEMFGTFLFRAGSYFVQEIEQGSEYLATHVKADDRERWYKTRYKVMVNRERDLFTCECGMYEHMGMVCSHALKVMIVLGLQKIPRRHIMKRWTVDARDVLLEHLKHYQKDMGPPESSTFRHNMMYNTALEVVHLGDSNPESFDYVITGLMELKNGVAVHSTVKDGKSMLEKSVAAKSGSVSAGKKLPRVCRSGKAWSGSRSADDAVRGGEEYGKAASEASSVHVDDQSSADSTSAVGNVRVSEIKAPERQPRKRGLPTTARDKPNYEIKDKRSRFCSICRGKGHKCSTCPECGNLPAKPRKELVCSNCGVAGHRKNSCGNKLISTMDGVVM